MLTLIGGNSQLTFECAWIVNHGSSILGEEDSHLTVKGAQSATCASIIVRVSGWYILLKFTLLFNLLCSDVVFTKIHVISMGVEKHLILAVTSLNCKTKESNLHIYYTLNINEAISIRHHIQATHELLYEHLGNMYDMCQPACHYSCGTHRVWVSHILRMFPCLCFDAIWQPAVRSWKVILIAKKILVAAYKLTVFDFPKSQKIGLVILQILFNLSWICFYSFKFLKHPYLC